MGSGAILREVIAGAELLENDFGISSDIWSVTSFTELRREADGVRSLEHAASRKIRRVCRMSSSASRTRAMRR